MIKKLTSEEALSQLVGLQSELLEEEIKKEKMDWRRKWKQNRKQHNATALAEALYSITNRSSAVPWALHQRAYRIEDIKHLNATKKGRNETMIKEKKRRRKERKAKKENKE